jgi:predicted RNA-binding Zn-ribbon protein involved in translation (DUF1610 family)
MDNMRTAFCTNCGKKVAYSSFSREDDSTVRGVAVRYTEIVAVCPNCDTELYVPEVNDANVEARQEAYKIASV